MEASAAVHLHLKIRWKASFLRRTSLDPGPGLMAPPVFTWGRLAGPSRVDCVGYFPRAQDLATSTKALSHRYNIKRHAKAVVSANCAPWEPFDERPLVT